MEDLEFRLSLAMIIVKELNDLIDRRNKEIAELKFELEQKREIIKMLSKENKILVNELARKEEDISNMEMELYNYKERED